MGEGSADIYVTRRSGNNWEKWSSPKNLGRPVNTRAFDAYLCVDQNENVFVTQSGRTIDGGNLDIFTLHQRQFDIQLKGLVADRETGDLIRAELQFIDATKAVDTLFTKEGTYQRDI